MRVRVQVWLHGVVNTWGYQRVPMPPISVCLYAHHCRLLQSCQRRSPSDGPPHLWPLHPTAQGWWSHLQLHMPIYIYIYAKPKRRTTAFSTNSLTAVFRFTITWPLHIRCTVAFSIALIARMSVSKLSIYEHTRALSMPRFSKWLPLFPALTHICYKKKMAVYLGVHSYLVVM